MEEQLKEYKSSNKWYMSSANAEKLSATFIGFFAVGVVSAISIILNMFGINIEVTDINSLVDSIGGIIIAIGGLGSSFVALFGILRKIYFKIKK